MYIKSGEVPMRKNEYVDKMYDLIEMMGEQALIFEFIQYSSADELKEFVEHCEQFFEVEL